MLTDTIQHNARERTRSNLLFGDWLMERGILSDDQLRAALTEQKRSGERLGRVLVQQQVLTESQLTESLSESLAVEHLALDDLSVRETQNYRRVPVNN